VNLWLAALAVAVVAGGVVAVSSRETRAAVLGLTVSGITAPLLADPLPAPLPLAARLIAAILAGYVLLISIRQRPLTRGSRLGWPVEALLAASAGVAGLGAAGFGGPAGGPAEAEAAAFALGALAIGPILRGADVFRLAIGLVLAVLAASVGHVALAGTPSALDEIVVSGLMIVLATAVATIAHAQARTDPSLTTTSFRIPAGALAARHVPPAPPPAPVPVAVASAQPVTMPDTWPVGTLRSGPPYGADAPPTEREPGNGRVPREMQPDASPIRRATTRPGPTRTLGDVASSALDRVRGRRP
jgi:hypothetical protein